jgi:hypothetical protein
LSTENLRAARQNDIAMLIPYLVKRGSFRPKFYAWITKHKMEISEGAILRINLGKTGGYPAEGLRITLSQADQSFFRTDWDYHDWTRFPARIRALATSLRDQNLWGTYLTFHNNGKVALEKIGG